MQSIESLGVEEASRLRGFLFDLDDTFLDGTSLGEESYRALFRLKESGLWLVAVTGRPSGWGEVIARQWPIEGVVVENGAIAHARVDGRIRRYDSVSAEERAARNERLEGIAAEVSEAFPTLLRTEDAWARQSDITFDIGENESVDPALVDEAIRTARALGARAVRSSVHLHLSLDGHDKATGTLAFLSRRVGLDPGAAPEVLAFIGDSDNDAPCFAAFRTTIAVANFSGRPTIQPRYLTRAARGAGFVEAARVIVERRQRGSAGVKAGDVAGGQRRR